MVILAVTFFSVHYAYNTNKGKTLGQLLFTRDTILPISHIENWKLILQQKTNQIDTDVIDKDNTRNKYYYRVGDNVLIRNIKHTIQNPV